ncbi:hypothetical protein L7F22_060711 [Adiantum nelumboides]|nr:hypothetical protein [Adiantum nelumboides]
MPATAEEEKFGGKVCARVRVWRLEVVYASKTGWAHCVESGVELAVEGCRENHRLGMAARQDWWKTGKNVKTAKETIVPEPDYRIPIVLLGGAAALVSADNLLAAAPVGLLGLLLLFQTTRVRFVFDNEALEVKVGEELKDSGENVFVGGKNRWKF